MSMTDPLFQDPFEEEWDDNEMRERQTEWERMLLDAGEEDNGDEMRSV